MEQCQFGALVSPLFNHQQNENCLAKPKDWDTSRDSYFNGLGIKPFTLHDEDLSVDYATIPDGFDHLGPADHAIPPTDLRRQADSLNENWPKRFEAWQETRVDKYQER